MERKHPPSAKRLREATARGQVPRSTRAREALGATLGVLLIIFGTPFALVQIKDLLHYLLSQGTEDLPTVAGRCLLLALALTASVLVSLSVVGTLAGGAQTRFAVVPTSILPRLERLSPGKGFERIARALGDARSWGMHYLLGVATLLVALYWSVERLPREANVEHAFRWLGWLIVGAALVTAVVDHWRVRRNYRDQLFMTDDELRRELRDDEGDPWIKHARRGMHEELAMADLVERVRKAQVIVVERLKS